MHDLVRKPMFFMSNLDLGRRGDESRPGRRTASASQCRLPGDSSDPTWKDDAGMNEWCGFMNKRMPGADQTDGGYIAA